MPSRRTLAVQLELPRDADEVLGHLHVLGRPPVLAGELREALLLAQRELAALEMRQVRDARLVERLLGLDDCEQAPLPIEVLATVQPFRHRLG